MTVTIDIEECPKCKGNAHASEDLKTQESSLHCIRCGYFQNVDFKVDGFGIVCLTENGNPQYETEEGGGFGVVVLNYPDLCDYHVFAARPTKNEIAAFRKPFSRKEVEPTSYMIIFDQNKADVIFGKPGSEILKDYLIN